MNNTALFTPRKILHDEVEERIMDVIRPFTTRRHLPDRWVSFNNKICAWDMKTNIFVEKNSHDEYFRLLSDEGIPVFIVYQNKKTGEVKADWIYRLGWSGPYPPSKNSTCGDPYYVISGGKSLEEFLEDVKSL